MTDDATLSDFGVGTSEDSDADSRTDETDDGGDADRPTSDEATERSGDNELHVALSTYAWGEYTCSRCGNDGDRVWRDDGAFVCPACKEW